MLEDCRRVPTTPGLPSGSDECPGTGDEPTREQSIKDCVFLVLLIQSSN
ncbi:MAG: hypothetical protein ACTSQE_00830 [Candidatus Heimdallarchaeaceae archaeon]